MKRLKEWLANRREQRAIARLQHLLERHGAILAIYDDGLPAWIDLYGHRLYFEGRTDHHTITTYRPVRQERGLTLIHYRP